MVAFTLNSDTGAALTGDVSAYEAWKLTVYNGALRIAQHTRISALTEDLEARYLLDDAWENGAVQACLEEGLWSFARRTSQLDADTDLTPSFGYQYAFEKPGDWVRTMATCVDDRFSVPLTTISDEAGYFYSDTSTFYLAYVSNDPSYGANVGLWPQSFVMAVQGYLAAQIAPVLTGGSETKIGQIRQEAKRLMEEAKGSAAMNESARFLPAGSWTRARRGNRSSLDWGRTSSLTG